MNEQQKRLIEDLVGEFQGEIRADPLALSMYSTDASLYEIRPFAVAFPRSVEDVRLLAVYAAEKHLELIPRGAGTGLAGAAIGAGIIVDFSRHMTAIESIDAETVRVQPGVVCDNLNLELKKQGRYFAPDPSNSAVTTIGGMVGVDAAGSHAARVGSTRDHVLSAEMILAGGDTFEVKTLLHSSLQRTGTGLDSLSRSELDLLEYSASKDRNQERLSRLVKILSDNKALIDRHQPPMIRNCSGYMLRGVLQESHLHLARLITGSEGTLGLLTSLVLHTSRLPEHRGVALILFDSMDAALDAAEQVEPFDPSACDLLDRRLLGLSRESPDFRRLIPESAEAGLIIEQIGFSAEQAAQRIRKVIARVTTGVAAAHLAAEAHSSEQVEFLWSLPRRVVPLLTRLHGSTRPQPFVEDIAVPPEAMKEFLHKAQRVFQKYEVTNSLYAHAASGQIHLRPFLTTPEEADGHRIEGLARDLYQIVFQVGGTISGEHGDGLSRTSFLRSQYGPLYRVFQQVKDLFDPANLMNPGKIVCDDPHLTRKNFRKTQVPDPPTVNLQLNWNQESAQDSVLRCNGCGVCRTQAEELRMCPFFRIASEEESSPRSKANLLRAYLSGQLDEASFTSDEMRGVTSTCFNCKQCQLECPSQVDIPKMMIEARANFVQTNGLSRADWILSRAHSFGALGSALPRLSNGILGNSAARWFVEKILGISRQRRLPRFAQKTFLNAYAKRNPPRPQVGQQRIVVYFVDSYANYHDTQLAEAFVAVLNHHGYEVFVPPDQKASGMAMISAGDLDSVRPLIEHNVRVLGEFAREGIPVICTDPSAALCLSQEYPNLTDHPDQDALSKATVEATAFLAGLLEQGKLKQNFQPIEMKAVYHTPCHVKALGAVPAVSKLLALIPGLELHSIEKGCSGMAGAFGLTSQHFETSMKIGEPLFEHIQERDYQLGVSQCSSCRMQIEQGTTIAAMHPVKLLALAYGLMPEIRSRLEPSRNPLLTT